MSGRRGFQGTELIAKKKLEKSLKKVLTKRVESDILFELPKKRRQRTLKIKQRYE